MTDYNKHQWSIFAGKRTEQYVVRTDTFEDLVEEKKKVLRHLKEIKKHQQDQDLPF